MEKKALRQQISQQRQQLSADTRRELSNKIINILQLELTLDNNCLLYYPIRNEVNLLPLVKIIITQGGQPFLPVVSGSKLEFRTYNGEEELVTGAFGIPEPNPSNKTLTKYSPTDMLFVPGIAFTDDGFRIGYGGGFYDRFLPAFPGKSTGICYHFQLVQNMSIFNHDQPVDYICTEDGLIQSSKNRGQKEDEISNH